MASKTDICNFALSAIGSKRITAVTDDNERARVCDLFYDQARLETLQAHPWGSATARASVAADATAPTWGYDNRYLLPSDFVRAVSIDSASRNKWEIEGAYLVTNEDSPLSLKYVYDLQDTTKMSPTLVAAISLKLAVYIVERLVNESANKKAQLELKFQETLRSGKHLDGRERSPQPLADTSWILARV